MYHTSQLQEIKAYMQLSSDSTKTEMRCTSATIALGLVCVTLTKQPILCQLKRDFPSNVQGIDNNVEGVTVNDPPDTLVQLYSHHEYTFSLPEVLEGACCDICSGEIMLSTRLDILVSSQVTWSRKPKAVQFISSDTWDAMKMALVQERKIFLRNS